MAELLAADRARQTGPRDSDVLHHLTECAACTARLNEMRGVAADIRAASEASVPGCLDAAGIAAMADGATVDSESLAHVAACNDCRQKVAAISRLLRDDEISREIEALRPARELTVYRWSRSRVAVSGVLVAAAAAIVLLGPVRARMADGIRATPQIRREADIAAAPVPRVLSPIGSATSADSLRWASVPQADLYRVRVWNESGDVVWSTEIRATASPIPPVLKPGARYLWDVAARIGWDRWVSSDLSELTLSAAKLR